MSEKYKEAQELANRWMSVAIKAASELTALQDQVQALKEENERLRQIGIDQCADSIKTSLLRREDLHNSLKHEVDLLQSRLAQSEDRPKKAEGVLKLISEAVQVPVYYINLARAYFAETERKKDGGE